MITKSITITRNFRTHNEDVYLKETRERIVDLQDGEDATEVEQIVLQDMISSFKKSYPKVEEHLNFHVERQVDLGRHEEPIFNIKGYEGFNGGGINPKPTHIAIPEGVTVEKINKETTEEQIQASKDLDELDGWKLLAKSNKKLQQVFNQREKELINAAVK